MYCVKYSLNVVFSIFFPIRSFMFRTDAYGGFSKRGINPSLTIEELSRLIPKIDFAPPHII